MIESMTEEEYYELLRDPVLLHYLLFERELPPHQRIMLRLMWWCPFYVDTSGYRTGKSSTATYCQIQQCLMIPGWQEGILSHTLRGSQYLFRDHIDYQYTTNPRFRYFVKKIVHGPEWRVEFNNGSSITAFPSDILNKSMRLESLSLHGATIDEATSFPDPNVLWDVMLNRVTMPVPPEARQLGITNTVRVLGAAKFTFQQIYRSVRGQGGLVHMVIRRMKEWAEWGGEPTHIFMSMNLEDHLPKDDECLICGGKTEKKDENYVLCRKCSYVRPAWERRFSPILERMRDAKYLMAPRLFAMRWRGEWQDSSEDVYSPTAIYSMKQPECVIEKSRTNENNIYTFGVDIGTGATERDSVSAITVIKLSPPDPRFHLVYAERIRSTLTELSGRIHDLNMKFNPAAIMIDPGGGGIWLVDNDHLGNKVQIIERNGKKVEVNVEPLLLMDDQVSDYGSRKLCLFTPSNPLLVESVGGMGSSDQLINWAHDLVSGLIDNRQIIAPGTVDIGDSTMYNIMKAIDEVLSGLLEIGVVQDMDGTPILTKNGYFSYHPKPDLAYSFVYAVCCMYLVLKPKVGIYGEEQPMVVLSSESNVDQFSDESEQIFILT
ncbi:MAG: hypothetical protein QXS29_09705 [Nitrososphaeria archaeon]